MKVNELIEKLKELQNKGLGEFDVILSKYENKGMFGFDFFSLSDVGYSDKDVIISIDEN